MATTIIRYRSGLDWTQKQIEYPTLDQTISVFLDRTQKCKKLGDLSIDGKSTTRKLIADLHIQLLINKLKMFE